MTILTQPWLSLFILTALVNTSCAHVAINDHEWCGDKAEKGALCFHTLTNESRQLSKEEWDATRFGNICTHDQPGHLGETFAEMKANQEKLCNYSKICIYFVSTFLKKVNDFQQKAIEEKNNALP